VLDFVDPQRAGRWPGHLRRQAWFDEAGGAPPLDHGRRIEQLPRGSTASKHDSDTSRRWRAVGATDRAGTLMVTDNATSVTGGKPGEVGVPVHCGSASIDKERPKQTSRKVARRGLSYDVERAALLGSPLSILYSVELAQIVRLKLEQFREFWDAILQFIEVQVQYARKEYRLLVRKIGFARLACAPTLH
jgi:hypothetical protein